MEPRCSNCRTAAMAAMQAVKFQGDAVQWPWKMKVMAASRETYASGATMEHFVMGCLLSSFQGASSQVQSMMANDINSVKVGPGMQLEGLVFVQVTVMMRCTPSLICFHCRMLKEMSHEEHEGRCQGSGLRTRLGNTEKTCLFC